MDPFKIAGVKTDNSINEIYAKSDKGSFKTFEEAQDAALKTAKSATEDAVILPEGSGFHVYGVDELHPKLPAGKNGKLVSEAPIISFVSTDPLTGQENIMGQSASRPQPVSNNQPKTEIEKYTDKFDKQITKVLGNDKTAYLEELKSLENSVKSKGININIELSDDVFETKKKLDGYKNMLSYIDQNTDAFKERNIKQISVVDEIDNFFGVVCDLDYDKKENQNTLKLGDDYLSDWGKGLMTDEKSVKKLTKALGKTLSDEEIKFKNETFDNLKGTFAGAYQKINALQQKVLEGKNSPEIKDQINEIGNQLKELKENTIKQAKDKFKHFSVSNQSEMLLDQLEKFSRTLDVSQEQVKQLAKDLDTKDQTLIAGRMEKLKIDFIKGVKEAPVSKNSFMGDVSSSLGGGSGLPGAGLTYTRYFDDSKSTYGSVSLGSTDFKVKGTDKTDIILGLGLGKTFASSNKIVDGAYVGVGLGFGRDTPVYAGLNLDNSWYLNKWSGQAEQTSVVGGIHASIGLNNNVGAFIDVNKKVNSKFEVEGTAELSLLNQNAEVEVEYALTKNKDLYLTAGVGVNKLLYTGVGFAGKYELEVGLGGISFGKDSNNLPGETSWEVGLRSYLPVPYFKHHRVPGYNFEYGDKSKEYITPQGTFMTIKKDANDQEKRISYLLDESKNENNKIAYRIVQSANDLKNMDKTPSREISIGPLGYLTVKDGDKTLIDDGFIMEPLDKADIGIITDQAAILWYDKMKKDNEQHLVQRRTEIPLPLYRAVYH